MKTDFDAFARDYSAGMEDPIKVALGKSAAAFLLAKTRLLGRSLKRHPQFAPGNAAVRMLDFGCGTGDFLALMADQGFRWLMQGCDVSKGILAEAKRRHPELGLAGKLWLCDPDQFTPSDYDIITAVCVFHHIPSGEWQAWFSRLRSALRPGGLFFLFEHNPWNPLTRWIVSRTPIDRNSALLSPPTARRKMMAAGFSVEHARYLLFFPPRFQTLQRLDHFFSWTPFGGQYCLTGEARPLSYHQSSRAA
jgi:SAM-dependent methyltransferase